MTILNTNAKAAYDEDGDFMGHALPADDPVRIDIRFRPAQLVDELVYIVHWRDGIFAEMSTIPNRWHGIYLASVRQRADANLARVDRTLKRAARPLVGSAA